MFDRSRASRRAVACPIPLDAPVISITRGWRLLGSVPIARPLWFGSCAAPTASARLAFQTANQMEPDVAPAMTHPDAGATPSPRKVAALELVSGLPFASASFDAVSFTYLLRYVDDPAATMRELARVLRPGGRIASLEFGVPSSPPARAAWRVYTAVGLPLLGRAVSREWYEVGRFLGPSIREFYARNPLEAIAGIWRDAGLS